MISRICEVLIYSNKTDKFYYKKYKSIPHCKSIDMKTFKEIMKKKEKQIVVPKIIFIHVEFQT